jgi:hypothetical protein
MGPDGPASAAWSRSNAPRIPARGSPVWRWLQLRPSGLAGCWHPTRGPHTPHASLRRLKHASIAPSRTAPSGAFHPLEAYFGRGACDEEEEGSRRFEACGPHACAYSGRLHRCLGPEPRQGGAARRESLSCRRGSTRRLEDAACTHQTARGWGPRRSRRSTPAFRALPAEARREAWMSTDSFSSQWISMWPFKRDALSAAGSLERS